MRRCGVLDGLASPGVSCLVSGTVLDGVDVMDQKVRENRLRRAAIRQGLKLNKSRQRDPRGLTFDKWLVVDASMNVIVPGGEFITLDQVEELLGVWA